MFSRKKTGCSPSMGMFLRFKHELNDRLMTLPAWLLVFYSAITGMTVEIAFSVPITLSTDVETYCYAPLPDTIVSPKYRFILQTSMFCIFYPFTGWLSDIVIGRDKALGFSLWSCWLGTLLQCISYCIQYGTCGLPVNIAKYGISGVAYLLIIIGNAGLFTNIPAYGIDLLFDKPHTHSRAFMYWTVWGIFLGFLAGYLGFVPDSIYRSQLVQITGVTIFFFTSVALCTHMKYRKSFETVIITRAKDPYKLVYCVLKYAWYHTAPERRSAMTFWEDKTPSRIDLAKNKYGGPLTEGDVEDVKTFLRIMTVMFCTFGLFIPYYHVFIGALSYVNSYKDSTSTLSGYGSFVLWKSFDSSVLIYVPLLQLIIIPLYPKIEYFLKRPLRGFVFCFVLHFLSLLVMILLECFTGNEEVGTNGHFSVKKDVSFLYFSIPLLFSGLADTLSLILGLEFICSQAPSNMKGMLTGLYWFLRNFYTDIGASFSFLHIIIDKHSQGNLQSNFWILLIQSVICICGLVLFIITAMWYTRRKRGEDYSIHANVENVYHRKLMQTERVTSDSVEAPIAVYYNTF